MVRIRLARVGAKKRPFYRIVAADSRSPRDGKFIEILGSYSPISDPEVTSLKPERIIYWLEHGAQMTERVRAILKKQGVLRQWKEGKAPEPEAPAEPQEEARAEEAPEEESSGSASEG
mgnify:CR=1 FL=1